LQKLRSFKNKYGETMIAWIAAKIGFSQLAVKLILSAVAIAGILYGLRLWGNRQWYQGELQGRQLVARDMVKQKQIEWKAKDAAIAVGAAKIEDERRALQAVSEQLTQDRTRLSRSLNDALAAVARAQERNYATVSNIPDSELDSTLRAISAQLAAAK
jgi:hypothetical protein